MMSVLLCLAPLFVVVGLRVWERYSTGPGFCKILGWHKRPEPIKFDGASLYGTCPRCKKRIMQDGQGNWYKTKQQEVETENLKQ